MRNEGPLVDSCPSTLWPGQGSSQGQVGAGGWDVSPRCKEADLRGSGSWENWDGSCGMEGVCGAVFHQGRACAKVLRWE